VFITKEPNAGESSYSSTEICETERTASALGLLHIISLHESAAHLKPGAATGMRLNTARRRMLRTNNYGCSR
jgi:hypothetical protein